MRHTFDFPASDTFTPAVGDTIEYVDASVGVRYWFTVAAVDGGLYRLEPLRNGDA